MDDFKKELDTLVDLIASDELLDEATKESLTGLVTEALGDPTPENLRALALVLEQVGNTERYMNALAIVKGAI